MKKIIALSLLIATAGLNFSTANTMGQRFTKKEIAKAVIYDMCWGIPTDIIKKTSKGLLWAGKKGGRILASPLTNTSHMPQNVKYAIEEFINTVNPKNNYTKKDRAKSFAFMISDIASAGMNLYTALSMYNLLYSGINVPYVTNTVNYLTKKLFPSQASNWLANKEGLVLYLKNNWKEIPGNFKDGFLNICNKAKNSIFTNQQKTHLEPNTTPMQKTFSWINKKLISPNNNLGPETGAHNFFEEVRQIDFTQEKQGFVPSLFKVFKSKEFKEALNKITELAKKHGVEELLGSDYLSDLTKFHVTRK